MRKYAKTFHSNKGCNLAIVFLYQFRRFQNRNLGCNFQTLFARKRGLAHPYFLYENESLRHCLSYYLRRMATFLVLEVRFFQGVHSSSGPGSRSGSGFQTMPKTNSSFRNFKNRVHSLKWWLFSGISNRFIVIYISVTIRSHLMLEKKNYLSKWQSEGTYLLNQTREKKLTHGERLAHENLLIKKDENLYSLSSCFL